VDAKLGAQSNPRTAQQKLRPPTVTGRAIDRPRLVAGLDSTLTRERAFAMLSAPAGFGKTYLLAQWAVQLGAAGTLVAWCSLTGDDRDPHVLWNTVLDSIGHAARAVDPQLAATLAGLEPDLEPLAHACFLAKVDAALTAHGQRIVLIIDSAELIQGTAAEREFVDCLQSVPDNVHVAFATRSPLHTEEARVNGTLVELTAVELSFTRAEAGALFTLRGVYDERVERIHDEAEGWPAALSLAAGGAEFGPLALQDYLRHEVYEKLDERSQRAIVALGVTPVITPELAVELTGDEHVASVLRHLAEDNHLVYRVPTDAPGRVSYRVHRLFGAFLREQLREDSPGLLSALTEKAIDWHIELGDPLVAVELAIDPPRPELVERVLRRRGYELVGDGHSAELLAVMPARTGELTKGAFARLMLAYAAVACRRLDQAEELLSAPQLEALSADDLLEWDWLHYLVRLQLAIARGLPNALLSSGWRAETLDQMPTHLQVAVRLAEGLAEARGGNTRRAATALRVALASAENSDDLSSMVLGTVGLAASTAMGGDFRIARRLSEQAIELSARTTTQYQTDSQSVAHALASWSAHEMLDLSAARSHASEALALAEEHGDASLILQARHAHTDVHFDLISEKRRMAQEFVTAWPPPYLKSAARTAAVASVLAGMRMSSHLGEHRWSDRLLDSARQSFGEDYDWQVLYALHLMATGRDDAARTVLTALGAGDSLNGTAITQVVAATMDGILKSRANNAYQAHAAIYRALELADDSGCYLELTRVDQRTLTRVLADGSGRFGPHEHIARLILASESGDLLLTSGSLTTREKQILSELRTLRTVEEIAHDLLLSVNTVKTHMRGIYRKLGVTSRRQAVTTAERYGLL
jgi:LuxR family transcriptional regulator, maltose regulon positive regulatory protein